MMIGKLWRRLQTSYEFSRLGNGLGGAVAFAQLNYAYLQAKRGKPLGLKFQLKKFGRSFEFHAQRPQDVSVLREVLVKDEYEMDFGAVETVLDLGSNVGASVIFFALKYPNARVVGIEPDPIAFQTLKLNAAQFENIEIYQYAVSGSTGKVQFNSNPNNTMSSSLIDRGDAFEKTTVDGYTLNDIISKLAIDQIDILKFDIEGGEEAVFKAFTEINSVNGLIGEFHGDLIEMTTDEFAELMNPIPVEFTAIDFDSEEISGRYLVTGLR